jgi:hypothetical protein
MLFIAGFNFPLWAQTYFKYHPSVTLCHKGENILFSCNLEGGTKIVSVCSSPYNGLLFGNVKYRFKAPDRPNFEFPEKHEKTASFVSGNSVENYASGMLSYISLMNKGSVYSVFSIGQRHPYYEGGGLIVTKNEKIINGIKCDDDGQMLSGELVNNRKLFGDSIPMDNLGLKYINTFVKSPSFESSLPKNTTLCHAGETSLFSCGIENKKKVSICARPLGDLPYGNLQYRFKEPSHAEFEFPKNSKPASDFASGDVISMNTSETLAYIRLKNKETTYSAFGINMITGGVFITRHKIVIAKLVCDDFADGGAMLLDDKLFGVSVPRDKAGIEDIRHYVKSIKRKSIP